MGTAIAVRYRILCCPNAGRGVTSNWYFLSAYDMALQVSDANLTL